ncbi:MAG TPA: DegT/DnrJ/EryC1/StrS family aminotransferase [Longimicrobiaceae bacterium]|nr:DegT/DnrJ/EryC1/StrS family aminotransferase [Longimicrobiaceae bacterium]
MPELAILGGEPILPHPLRPYRTMGAAEAEAVRRVVESDCLSGFYGSPGEQFLGGPRVKEFERAWSERFGVRHTVSVNSATSGLCAAMGAIGIRPGDEVIVPPLTMSATAMAPLVYGGVPVFADVEPETFCLDVDAVRRAITPRTRAILAVNLFGHPAPLARLRALADEHGIRLVEDNAQGPLAAEDGRPAGTVGDVGVFSLNYHKHIHTGEGGMCVTDDDDLALRMQMIRNHAENVVEAYGVEDITNLLGFNYRLTELSAAVGLEQLRRIEEHVGPRVRLAETLTAMTEGLEGLIPPRVRTGCDHAYYVWALRLDEEAAGVPREAFSRALAAEGFPHGVGYVRPLYLLPLFQRRAEDSGVFGRVLAGGTYPEGLCPVAERLHRRELLMFETCAYDVDASTAERLGEAIRKVHANREALAGLAPAGA